MKKHIIYMFEIDGRLKTLMNDIETIKIAYLTQTRLRAGMPVP